MKALIFDLYHTLLQLDPPSEDREERWRSLWLQAGIGSPRLSVAAFLDACRAGVAVERSRAQAAGVAVPEVIWPRIVDAVLPEFAVLAPDHPARRAVSSSGLLHRVSLALGATEVLRLAARKGLLLGLASNCQAYSVQDLASLLAERGLSLELFSPDLRALSFELGFAKPDPHLFRLLSTRLLARGVEAADVLMVGDREDNDLSPARDAGWDAFRIIPREPLSWRELGERIAAGPADPRGGA